MMILQQTRGNLSSGDQLAIDLPFAATKSLTARVGPTPVFSRASGATYVGSDGLIHGIDTSTTSNSISTGSKSFTLQATAGQDQLWRTGDAVEASNGSNSMVGTVTSYNSSTQVLVCNMTSIAGTGTFTSWRIGYRGPRFDHNPVSPFACRGLLIEESRTNLLQRSEEFDNNTYWATVRAPQPTANAAVSPDGTTTADKLIADTTAANNHRVDRSPVTLALNTIYTVSVFAKAGEYTGIALGVGLSVTRGVDYSLVGAGTATPVSGAGHTGTIQQLANGWYRCTATFTSDATTALHRVAIYVGQNGTTFTYAGDNTSGIFIWGAQLEAGSFPTSYIPTTTSSLNRSADVCSISGAAFDSFYNQSEGTLFADVSGLMNTTLSGNRSFVSISDGTYQNYIQINKVANSGFLNAFGVASNSTQFNFSNTYSPSTQYKVALGLKTNDANAAFNGSLGTTDVSVTMPTTMNRLELRDPTSAAGGQPTCTIAAIRYYRKRPANQKLQALTA